MPITRQKLTVERIRKHSLPGGKTQAFLWDSDVTSLACRVTKGTKAYTFQSVFAGKTLRMTIGNINDWRIDEARVKAEKIAEAKSQQAELRKVKITFSDAWEDYIKELRTGVSAKTKRP